MIGGYELSLLGDWKGGSERLSSSGYKGRGHMQSWTATVETCDTNPERNKNQKQRMLVTYSNAT